MKVPYHVRQELTEKYNIVDMILAWKEAEHVFDEDEV